MTERMFGCYNIAVAVERRYNVTTNESGNSLDPNERKKKTARELIRSGLSTDEFFSSVGMSPDE